LHRGEGDALRQESKFYRRGDGWLRLGRGPIFSKAKFAKAKGGTEDFVARVLRDLDGQPRGVHGKEIPDLRGWPAFICPPT
jgi:hypothetical protein